MRIISLHTDTITGKCNLCVCVCLLFRLHQTKSKGFATCPAFSFEFVPLAQQRADKSITTSNSPWLAEPLVPHYTHHTKSERKSSTYVHIDFLYPVYTSTDSSSRHPDSHPEVRGPASGSLQLSQQPPYRGAACQDGSFSSDNWLCRTALTWRGESAGWRRCREAKIASRKDQVCPAFINSSFVNSRAITNVFKSSSLSKVKSLFCICSESMITLFAGKMLLSELDTIKLNNLFLLLQHPLQAKSKKKGKKI